MTTKTAAKATKTETTKTETTKTKAPTPIAEKAAKEAAEDKVVQEARDKQVEEKSELDALRAELEALKAAKEALEAKLKAKPGMDAKRAEWQADPKEDDYTAAPDSELGKAQRLERAKLLQVVEKTLRAIPYREVPAVLADLAKRAAQSAPGKLDATDEQVNELVKAKAAVRDYKWTDGREKKTGK